METVNLLAHLRSFNCKQLEEIQNKTKTQLHEFSSLDRSFSKNSSKSLFNCASEENDFSDTSLQLGYVIKVPLLLIETYAFNCYVNFIYHGLMFRNCIAAATAKCQTNFSTLTF